MTPISPPRTQEASRTPPAAGASLPAGEAARATAAAGTTTVGTAPPNPALRMDPELGLVILEFRDRRGEVAATIPTSRELDAYRRAARAGAPRPTT